MRRVSAEDRRIALAKAVAASAASDSKASSGAGMVSRTGSGERAKAGSTAVDRAAATAVPLGRPKPTPTRALVDAVVPTAKRLRADAAPRDPPPAAEGSGRACPSNTTPGDSAAAPATMPAHHAPNVASSGVAATARCVEKRVRWATQLVHVREIPCREQLNSPATPAESFKEQLQRDHDVERQSIKEHRPQGAREPRLHPTTSWAGPPPPFALPAMPGNPVYLAERGKDSIEKGVQRDRETRTLAEQFYSLRDVPPSAAEPDHTSASFGASGINDHHTPVIPVNLQVLDQPPAAAVAVPGMSPVWSGARDEVDAVSA